MDRVNAVRIHIASVFEKKARYCTTCVVPGETLPRLTKGHPDPKNLAWTPAHVPHVGSRYGETVRIAMVGLEDPSEADSNEDPLDRMNRLGKKLEKTWDFHRRGERLLLTDLLQDQGISDLSNPFDYAATLNSHLCALTIAGTSRSCSKYVEGDCLPTWDLLRELDPDVIVIESAQLRGLARRMMTGGDHPWGTLPPPGLPWVGRVGDDRGSGSKFAELEGGTKPRAVLFVTHPSAQGLGRWSERKRAYYQKCIAPLVAVTREWIGHTLGPR